MTREDGLLSWRWGPVSGKDSGTLVDRGGKGAVHSLRRPVQESRGKESSRGRTPPLSSLPLSGAVSGAEGGSSGHSAGLDSAQSSVPVSCQCD